MAVYSFLDVNATLVGPGAVVNLGEGAAAAEEGITITPMEDKNVMQIGADGRGQHSLIANEAGTVTVRILKTSPINSLLQVAYTLQTTSASLHGRNVISLTNPVSGDAIICQSCAFKKAPELTYAKEAGFNEWTFDSLGITRVLGSGA